jgi:hypothetical protein
MPPCDHNGGMTPETPRGGLTDAELRQLAELMARYADHDLDQFEHWIVESVHGPVFIDISRHSDPAWRDWYQTLWPFRSKADPAE